MSQPDKISEEGKMTQEQDKADPISVVRKAVSDPNIPKQYANGFSIGLSNADSYVLFQLDGLPVVLMHISYTLAKTLYKKLERMVSEFETNMDQELLTTDQVDEIFKEKTK